MSSTRTPHTTPVINDRSGFIFGALAKNDSKSVSLRTSAISCRWE